MSGAYRDDAEPPDPRFRPVWEDAPDETDRVPGGGTVALDRILPTPNPPPAARLGGDALATLLVPLCEAQDALARLDAAAAAAPAAVREGLCARMAFAEAAGWLAHAHAWVHPLDLALRDLGLTGSYAIATRVGRPMREMPNTYARRATRPWEEQDAAGMMAGDRRVATALALARQLARLARTREDPFGSLAAAATTLNRFGPEMPDPTRFAQWRTEIVRNAQPSMDGGEAEGAGEGGPAPRLPPLLAAARAAEHWMTGGIVGSPAGRPAGSPVDLPTPLQALLAGAGLLVGGGALRAVIPPLWAACPTLGEGDPGALPLLRSDVAARLASPGAAPGWLLAFLHLLAEGARAASRDLDRLREVAERGRALTAGCDRRARLPAALDAVLRRAVLTPKGLAAELDIAPQTATALLRELRAAKLVTEITGRRSFRAFAAVTGTLAEHTGR